MHLHLCLASYAYFSPCHNLRLIPLTHATILTVSDGLHAEAQQCMQEVHYVIERIFVDVLAHCLSKLHLVQLIKAGQAVLGLKERI